MNATTEVDCGNCPSGRRCWPDRVTANSGFIVRRMKRLAGGERLVSQGEPFESPFIVTGGCIAVTELLPDGDERIVAFRAPGELLGIESWQGATHRYGAQAVGDATVCRIRWSKAGIAGRPPLLARALLSMVSHQLDRATRIWSGLPAVERVREFVADFVARSPGSLPMTRAQIGRHLGIAEETVVRAFSRLRRK